jgi:hypothetical protein
VRFDGITGLSLNGVRKLIEDKNLPEPRARRRR